MKSSISAEDCMEVIFFSSLFLASQWAVRFTPSLDLSYSGTFASEGTTDGGPGPAASDEMLKLCLLVP